MIKINNTIDSNFKARIYYKDKFIGECLNELAFLDFRLQVKKEQDENYSFELVKRLSSGTTEESPRYHLSKDGKYPLSISFELYWPSYDTILGELIDI